MGILTEINRISAAKGDLKTAINLLGGGLTDELVDEYAAKLVDADLAAGNIKTGVTIFGTAGTLCADATAAEDDILNTRTAYGSLGTKLTGTMPNNAAANVEVTDVNGTVIPAGYYNGSGSAVLSADEAAKVITGNIKSGVTLLGVAGAANVVDTTSGDAVASDIALNKKAWVDGAEVVGTSTKNADTTDATAVENSLLYGHTAYGADGTKLTGTGTDWRFIKSLFLSFMNSLLAGDVVIYAPNASVSREAFSGCSDVTSLILTFDTFTQSIPGGFYGTFSGMTSLTHLTLYGSTEAAVDFRNAFSGDTLLSVIDGDPLNLTGMHPSFPLTLPPGIVEVRFVPSTIKVSNSQASSPLLSTASLLSLANGLDAGTPATLTMHATSKTNMDNINVDVVDGVAILGTTKTLTQFITTDKGWTIA